MNAIIIEQDQDDTKRAFEVNQNAGIGRIRPSGITQNRPVVIT